MTADRFATDVQPVILLPLAPGFSAQYNALNILEKFNGGPMSSQLSIKGFYEIALPMVDAQQSKAFYQILGYEVFDEQDWGLLVMKRDDLRVALLSNAFFKQPAVCYWTDNLEKVMQELHGLNIEIAEDDSQSQPPRVTIYDPAKNEITIYQI